MNKNSIIGTGKQAEITITYSELKKIFGEPNQETNDKIDAQWKINTPFGIGTIYNYKNGKNYLGEDGICIEEITDWHIGGHNIETADWIINKLNF